jgi:HEAT repeat protein
LDVEDLDLPETGAVNLTKGYAADNIHSVVHLGKRTKPMPRPSMVDPIAERSLAKTGYLYCQNVLNTQHNTADLKRIKAVRIYEGRPFTLEPTKSIYVHIGTEGVELGTVPLAEDGSFYVEVPADRPLAMQAVDGEGRPVINEMSWIYVRPGEQRACVGCHSPPSGAPAAMAISKALMSKPLKLLAQGDPHRFRANNGANGGVLNLQLDRFREASSINLPTGSDELMKMAGDADPDIRLSAIRRMGILRHRRFVAGLSNALSKEKSAEIRCAAALSLSACGNRKAIGALSKGLKDSNATVRNAVRLALEHITGGVLVDFKAGPDWIAIEKSLIERLSSKDPQDVILALEALGHVGGAAGKKAIRKFLAENAQAELRIQMAAMRSLGYLKDTESIQLLTRLMNDNLTKKGGAGFHELGYGQKPIYISATAVEALGMIGTSETETAILDAFENLNSFEDYVFRVAEHSWLKGCHSSILHYRMLEALDRMESKKAGALVGRIVESLPADKDRGLLYELDSYEALSARVIARCQTTEKVIQACLAVLHGTKNQSDPSLIASVILSPHAEKHIRKYSPQARAAQVLSIVCSDAKYAPRIGELIKNYRAGKDSEMRNWCCFYLIRTLGRLGNKVSSELLIDILANDPTETAAGLNPPPTHIIYKGWRPFYRPAAAWSLGMLNEKKAVGALLDAVENLENASSVRQQAAIALGKIDDPDSLKRLIEIGKDYPEVITRRSILESIKALAE